MHVDTARTFVYFLEDAAKATGEVIEAHVAYLRELDDRGALVVCGPFRDGAGGGMVCITAESEAVAHAVASADPFVLAGCRRYHLREPARATRNNGYLLG